jgi:thiamine monophosphate synthase
MIIGVSARTPDLARVAAGAGATYVGAGAVFATTTKQETIGIGLPGLQEVVSTVEIPVVAIGGIGVMSALLTFRAWGRKSQGMFVD